MAYPGFRVSLKVQLEKMKDKIQIDIGVGDLVNPIEEHIDPFKYKGNSIYEDEITLLVYPLEMVFAEKLETIISKGSINSRMKDYHDLLLLSRNKNLIQNDKLLQAIITTFQHRETSMKFPIQFIDSGIKRLQNMWNSHLNSLGSMKIKLNLPNEMSEAITEINSFLETLQS